MFQELLIETADRSFQDVGDAEILCRDHFRRRFEFDLQDSAAHVDLQQVRAVVVKGFRGVYRRVELHLRLGKMTVDFRGKGAADGVQLHGSLAAKRGDLLCLLNQNAVFFRKRFDGLRQLSQSVLCQVGDRSICRP